MAPATGQIATARFRPIAYAAALLIAIVATTALLVSFGGYDVTREAVLDTIVFEPDQERFTLTWRTSLALGRSLFDVKETVAGEKAPGWHRARRSNKAHFSIEELLQFLGNGGCGDRLATGTCAVERGDNRLFQLRS